MIRNGGQKEIGWYVSGFRRYRPENRLNRGLISAAPWVNAALLVAFYLYLLAPNVLQPGITIRLPDSPFTGGRQYGHSVLVLSLPAARGAEREEIVFFDDQRYLERESGQMDGLRMALARAHSEKRELPLIIEADQSVRNGTLIRLFNMASDAGFRDVTLATQPARGR